MEYRWNWGLKSVYKKRVGLINKIPRTIYALIPTHLEVLCSEYLRNCAPEEIRIDYLLSPVGRGRREIDIDGVHGNRLVLAQVSRSKMTMIIEEKIKKLLTYSQDFREENKPIFLYFGPEEKRDIILHKYSDIKYIAIEEVMNKMEKTGIIDHMLS